MADGLLDKLKIIPFADAEGLQVGLPVAPPFIVQFNPETYSIKNEVQLNTDQVAQGANGAEAKQVKVEPREYTFDFLLDGTGASGPALDVTAQIELFKWTIGFSGESHRNHFLILQWGLFVTNCVIKSYSINYKLFRANGTPLRAVITATFQEHKSLELQSLINNLMSPDVTHVHEVIGAERLDYLCFQQYRDSRFYYHVAEANGLDTVRRINVGTELQFPPLQGDD